MSVLTWRELQAPDMRTSLEGYRQFSTLFDSALSRAQGTVDRINSNMDERANTGAMRIAAAVQDPEQAKLLLSNPEFMNNRLNMQTIAALSGRPTQLIAQAGAELGLQDMKRTQGQTLANDALAADLSEGYILRAKAGEGKLDDAGKTKLAEINARLMAAAGNVGSRNAITNLTTLDNAETGGLGRASTALGMDSTRLGMKQTEQNMLFAKDQHQWQVDDRNDQKLGDAAFLNVMGQIVPGDKESALAAFNSPEIQKLPPGARMRAFQGINAAVGNLFEPSQMADMSGFSGSGGGGLVGSESGGNWGALNGEGYGGRLQFGDARLADAANAGLVPKGTTGAQFSRMSPTQQQKVEQWHFQDVDQQAQKSGITRYIGRTIAGVPITPDSIRAMAHLGGVAGVKKFVESNGQYNPADSNGTRLSDYGRRFSAPGSAYSSQAGAAIRVGQDRTGKTNASEMIAAATNNVNTVRAAADVLRGGAFKGVGYDFLNKQLNDIVEKSKVRNPRTGAMEPTITYGQAAVILDTNLNNPDKLGAYVKERTDSSWGFRRVEDPFNRQGINEEIARAKSGGLVRDASREKTISDSAQLIAQAQQRAQRATAQYTAARMAMATTGQGSQSYLNTLKAKMDQANADLERTQGRIEQIAPPVKEAIATSTGQPSGGGIFSIKRDNGTELVFDPIGATKRFFGIN